MLKVPKSGSLVLQEEKKKVFLRSVRGSESAVRCLFGERV